MQTQVFLVYVNSLVIMPNSLLWKHIVLLKAGIYSNKNGVLYTLLLLKLPGT